MMPLPPPTNHHHQTNSIEAKISFGRPVYHNITSITPPPPPPSQPNSTRTSFCKQTRVCHHITATARQSTLFPADGGAAGWQNGRRRLREICKEEEQESCSVVRWMSWSLHHQWYNIKIRRCGSVGLCCSNWRMDKQTISFWMCVCVYEVREWRKRSVIEMLSYIWIITIQGDVGCRGGD